MNADEFKGKWLQLKGEIKSRWGDLTDDDLTVIEGNRDKLVGKLQERYGYSMEEAEREINDAFD
ncbi:putative stress response protein [Candidatus Methylobacter favarea]|uniref:Putative stress response protein n=1 Tax=Candidatus Methylobacter favarea TaxID=2707345 RepID=A0A8S0WCE3_9GAMM|nr:CsbD family protein [Candidatus Methylobacter favarea]CAA9892455.1 putative stress response protein [Candidatus Methylobacter favarea]